MAFDERADMRPVFAAAMAKAKASGKKILVEYGGDWCIWSTRMTALLANPEFSALLRQRFVFVRCHVGLDGHSSPPGIEFPRDLDSVPFFALMDADGRIVATQDTGDFTFLWFYWRPKVRRFLTRWASLSAG